MRRFHRACSQDHLATATHFMRLTMLFVGNVHRPLAVEQPLRCCPARKSTGAVLNVIPYSFLIMLVYRSDPLSTRIGSLSECLKIRRAELALQADKVIASQPGKGSSFTIQCCSKRC
jgi:hypothetical protein